MDSGTTSTIPLPGGQRYRGTFGSRVLTDTYHTGAGTTYDVLSLVNGQVVDTPVTGLPAGTYVSTLRAADANSVAVIYGANGQYQLGLLDMASGQLAPLNSGPVSQGTLAVLTANRIAWYDPTAQDPVLHLLDRSDLSAPETTVTVPTPPLPAGYTASVRQIGITGNSLLVAYAVTHSGASTTDDTLGYPLYSMPLTGGELSTVLDHERGIIETYADGALAVGGPSPADWAARRLAPASDGTLGSTALDNDDARPWPINGLSLAGGQLLTIEGTSSVYTRSVQLGTQPTYGAHTAFGTAAVPSNCGVAGSCAPPIGSGDGRMSQLQVGTSGDSATTQGPKSTSRMTPGAQTGGSLVDSNGRYVLYGNTSTRELFVGDMTMNHSSNVRYYESLTASALSGQTLWTASSSAGVLNSLNLSTLQPGRTITTGPTCKPTELQTAGGRWIYWSCGASGPAGVYDLATGKDISVPSGPSQLGEGFVVEHDATRGKLVLTDVQTDAAVTTDLADLPAPTAPLTDDRHVTWAVDKYDGGIAYLDATENIHIVDPHISPSPASGYRILPGQRLNPGNSLTSASMRLVMQSDGNLVAYLKPGGSAAPAEWSSGTWGHPGAYAMMQPDGNFVVYSADGGPGTGGALWSSNTSGNPGAYATIQDDGNLVIYRQGTTDPANALWSSGSYARPQTVASGQTMKPGWWTQGQYTFLVMQRDGNLVMYRKRDGAAIWSTKTWGHSGAYAMMQSDGNLVVYPKGKSASTGGALWSTKTWGHSGAYAVMQDDGNLVVYPKGKSASTGGALWASNTWKTAY
ncbi:hypothetical protein N8I84_32875 [Streptomyces cynarae]|uniref:Bulb-type lectin domain-containing protein n=1 Tax=Streptomyces cynarae TaxID=2981134 RepID=A0ABY6E8G8_9ACTN|nr:hypothetical protein [Streptomyces cynarae]UXY22962.1 hypothetical protein N8I84_32875 [Streptomyces cynarae]